MGGLSCHVELEERKNVVAVDVSKNRIKVIPTVLGGDKIGNVNIIWTDTASVALIECCFAKRHVRQGG